VGGSEGMGACGLVDNVPVIHRAHRPSWGSVDSKGSGLHMSLQMNRSAAVRSGPSQWKNVNSVLTVRLSPTHESRLGKRSKASRRSSSVVESRGV